jgi:curved DNA-binding protein CbpA
VAGGVDLYQVLGVEPDADPDELTRAYRRRLRQLHPDTQSGPPGGDPVGELAAVQHAYRVLRDPRDRSRYDEQRKAEAGRASDRDGARAASGWTGRGVPVPIPVRRRPAVRGGWLLRVGPVRVQPLPRRLDPRRWW